MNGLPYYKRYPRDLIEGTVGMPFEEKVTYAFILDLIYLHGGNLPDDARWIAGQLGVSVRKWNGLRDALIQRGKLTVSGDFLTNDRAIIELESLGKFQDKQSRNGSGSSKNNNIQKPRPNHTEPDNRKRETNVSLTREAFEAFWDAYGKKTARAKCEPKFAAAVRSGVDPETIINAARRYAAATPEIRYRKNPETWLNGRCWEDDFVPSNRGGFSNGRQWEGRGDARAAALRERRAARKGLGHDNSGNHEMAASPAAFGCGPDGEDQGDALSLLPAGPEPGGGGSGPGGLDRRPRRFSDLGDCGGVHDVETGEPDEASEPRWHPRVVHG